MRVLVDMNLSPRWVGLLAAAGFDSVHWSSVGACDAPDSTIMAYGAAHGCVVLTHDLDFGAILAATGGSKPSVVQLRADDVRPEAVGTQVVAALQQMAGELDDGALLTVDTNRSRMRLLPLSTGRGPGPN
jgi:predicted nuclease of predicted toxin-antitoxin system